MEVQEILKACTVEGKVVKLPNRHLDRTTYLEVKKSMGLINGKWKGGKVGGFVFDIDPTDLLAQISNGEKRNLKKEFQFFATPYREAEKVVDLADIREEHSILEPEAGQGALVEAVLRQCPNAEVDCIELMDTNRMFLDKIEGAYIVGYDFLEYDLLIENKYDRIIANPPFSKNQDIEHVYKMYKHLNDGGRLVSIVSTHWTFSKGKKETTFAEWLDLRGADIYTIPAGAFKESGTTIECKILVIDKG